MPVNRVVAIATAVLTLALGVLPVVADMDWTSTAGILAGVVAVLGVALKWLDGWQKHEDRQAAPWFSSQGLQLEPPPDEVPLLGDESAQALAQAQKAASENNPPLRP